MKINFYTDNQQKAPTVENFLFSDHYAEIKQGQFIEHETDQYRVNSLHWSDEQQTVLNAFVWKYPAKHNQLRKEGVL